MSDAAIRVEGLSKRYRIGVRERSHDTLGGALTDLAKRPFRNLRRLRELSTFDDSEDRDDVIWALDDVSFEVERGEIVGVIGRNGSGKSTIIKVLSRITSPTRGRVELSGRVGALLEVGTAFHPDLTGRENVYLNGSVLGMRKREIEARFDEIVGFSEVEKFIDMPVKRYSTGMALAARVLGRRSLGGGDTARRRGPRGRRREVPGEVRRQDAGRDDDDGADRAVREPQHGLGAAAVRPRHTAARRRDADERPDA